MNLKQLIIAFLSPRYPAAYTEESIAQRLNASQMLDRRCTPDEVSDELRTLKKMGLVDFEVNPYDTTAYWNATQAGMKEWVMIGRITV